MRLHLSIKLILLIALLFTGLLRPQPALAQQSPVIVENLSVDIWPEYDRPTVLVIYHISLSPQVTLPAKMEVRIPAAAGQPFAVATQDAAGLLNLPYQVVAAGDWIEVQFTTPVPEIRIEYYDPSLEKNGAERDYVFHWPGDYTVNNLSVSVQQPLNASGMSFRPAIGSGNPGRDGLTYYNMVAGKVNQGTTFELEISYEKPDDTLTNPQQFQPAQPNQAVDSATSGRVTLDQMLPWALGGVGLLFIVMGTFWYWKTGRKPASSTASTRQRHTRRTVTPVEAGSGGAAAGEGGGTFCHQCGKRAAQGDVFCRACGTKLR